MFTDSDYASDTESNLTVSEFLDGTIEKAQMQTALKQGTVLKLPNRNSKPKRTCFRLTCTFNMYDWQVYFY